jgi:hypothetical protein
MIVGCNSDDPDFSALDCKTSPSYALMPTGIDSDDYRGLTCVSYAAAGGDLDLDLINLWGNCTGIHGYLENASEDAIELMVKPPDCAELAKCVCAFDLHLAVSGVGTGPVTLSIGHHDCASGAVGATDVAQLPLGESPSGMACQYSDGGDDEMGLLFHRCSSDPQKDMTCADGLECAVNGTTSGPGEICLAPCAADADCPAPGALACSEDGLCRVAAELIRIWNE